MKKLLLKGGYVVDPSSNLKGKLDVLIQGGKVVKIEKNINAHDAEILNVEGKIIAPAFVDIHTHLRDPGHIYKEDMLSGSKSAVAGGYTALLCMPNTSPPIDSPETASYIREKSTRLSLCEIFPAGTLTLGRKGEKLSDFYSLKEAGCLAFTDDGSTLRNSDLMKKALEVCSELKVPVMNHCEDPVLAKGEVNEGEISALLGIKGRHSSAEEIMIARDCILAYHTGGHLHIQHISTSLAVEIVKFFKEKGTNLSCEVNPYHLVFTEREILRSGAQAKVNPPFRKEKDREKLLEALAEGIIDCIATDHAPHHTSEKGLVEKSLPGMISLQTALPIMLQLVREKIITLERMIELMSVNPAKIIGLAERTIAVNSRADIVVFDPEKEWILCEDSNFSKSKNTPLWNKELKGKVIYTLKEGKIVFRDPQ